MESRITFSSGGKQLVGLLGAPDETPAPGVVLFHGLSNTMRDCPLIKETATMLMHGGFFALRFDFYGSGESPGLLKDKTWEEMLRNAQDAIDYLAQQEGVSAIGLWGRSLGATFAILCGNDSRVDAVVLLSPDVLVTKTLSRSKFEELKRKQEELERKGKGLAGTGRYKGPLELHTDFFDALERIESEVLRTLPTLNRVLVVATAPDIKVPLENAITVINEVQEPKRIIVFENVDHDYAGVEQEAVEHIRRWFAHKLK